MAIAKLVSSISVGLSEKNNPLLQLGQGSCKFRFLQILLIFKPLSLLKLIFRATGILEVITLEIFQKLLFPKLGSNTNLALTATQFAAGQYL